MVSIDKAIVKISWMRVESPFENLPVIGYECKIYKTFRIQIVRTTNPNATTYVGMINPCMDNIQGFSVASVTHVGVGKFTAPLEVSLPSPGMAKIHVNA